MDKKSVLRTGLVGQLIWSTAATLVYALAQWLLLRIIINIGGLNEAGRYAYFMAILTPLLAATSFNLRAVSASGTYPDENNVHLFSLRLISSICGFLISTIIAVLVMSWELAVISAFLAQSAYRFFDVIGDFLQSKYQRAAEMHFAFMSSVYRCGLGIGAFYLLYANSHSLTLAFAGLLICSAVVTLMFDIPKTRNVFRFSPHLSKKLFEVAKELAPASIGVVLAAIAASVPRIILEMSAGQHELGAFAALSYIAVVAGVVATALGYVTIPILGRAWMQNEFAKLWQCLAIIVITDACLVLLLGAALIAGGEQILVFLFGTDMVLYADKLPIVVIAVFFQFLEIHFGNALTAIGGYKQVAAAQALRLIFTLSVACLLLGSLVIRSALILVTASAAFASLGSLALIYMKVRAATKVD
ncbi:MAG: hypothetical protein HYX71_08865 [Opitutae bacterium]|nr:hypothetical protein [Opitutae bacterium]